jgi:Protein of unknown function (DUF3175)
MPTAKRKSAKKKSTKKTAKGQTPGSQRKSGHRWVAGVKTESTFPEKGLFTRSASTIAKSLASKKTSPKGPASGMRMLNYYINRAGHNLSAKRKAELEKAKSILSDIIARQKSHQEKRAA